MRVLVAQWIERPPSFWEVTGSIPVGDSDFVFVPRLFHVDQFTLRRTVIVIVSVDWKCEEKIFRRFNNSGLAVTITGIKYMPFDIPSYQPSAWRNMKHAAERIRSDFPWNNHILEKKNPTACKIIIVMIMTMIMMIIMMMMMMTTMMTTMMTMIMMMMMTMIMMMIMMIMMMMMMMATTMMMMMMMMMMVVVVVVEVMMMIK